MIVFKEASSSHKELVQTLIPLVQLYRKSGASSKAVLDLVERMASVLEQRGYFPKEISGLDRRSFFDIVKEWLDIALAQDVSIIKSVFQI
jgi:hypothetical protein